MERITEDRLSELFTWSRFPSISLYMPTNSGRNLQSATDDKTRFLSLVSEVEELLVARGLRPPEAARLLTPLREQGKNTLLWRQAQRGVAVFRSHSQMRLFALPEPPTELASVGEQFYLKPLVGYLCRRGRFYILAVSENSAKLLAGDRYHIGEVEMPDVRRNFDEMANIHAARVAMTGGRSVGQRCAVLQTQGSARVQRKGDLEAYFRQIDDALIPLLKDASVPLIFAGMSYLCPLYRSVNKYPYLLGECIAGNTDLYSCSELRQRASALVEPFYARSREMAAARFARFCGTGRASNDINEVVWAARDGLIESLFVAIDGKRWGVIDDVRRTIEPAEATQPGAQELLNDIAVETFRNHGLVYDVNRSDVPGGELVAAVYRYPAMAPC
jgi:hypothetical protein